MDNCQPHEREHWQQRFAKQACFLKDGIRGDGVLAPLSNTQELCEWPLVPPPRGVTVPGLSPSECSAARQPSSCSCMCAVAASTWHSAN
eukprot:5838149-Pleurochrysis_carterae.AAC.1